MTLRLRAYADPAQLKEITDAHYLGIENAVSAGVRTVTEGLKLDLRDQMESAGLGKRLGNTWRSKIFPDDEPSAKAAGLVYSNAPEIVETFALGAEIRPSRKRFLAIPTQFAPERSPDGGKLAPSNYPGRKELIFRESRTGTAYLAVRRGRSLLPIFALVPVVRIKKRLDLDGAANRRIGQLPGEITKNLGAQS